MKYARNIEMYNVWELIFPCVKMVVPQDILSHEGETRVHEMRRVEKVR